MTIFFSRKGLISQASKYLIATVSRPSAAIECGVFSITRLVFVPLFATQVPRTKEGSLEHTRGPSKGSSERWKGTASSPRKTVRLPAMTPAVLSGLTVQNKENKSRPSARSTGVWFEKRVQGREKRESCSFFVSLLPLNKPAKKERRLRDPMPFLPKQSVFFLHRFSETSLSR